MVTSLAYFLVEEIPNEIVNMYSTFTQELFSLIFYFYSTYINGKNGTPKCPLHIGMSDTKRLVIHVEQIILVKDRTVHSINWLDRLIQISGVFCNLCD